MVAACLVVDDDDLSIGGDYDAVGSLLLALRVHEGEFVEYLKAGLEPWSHFGYGEDVGNGLLHLWLGDDCLVDGPTGIKIADDLRGLVGGANFLHDGVDVRAFFFSGDVGFGWVVEDGEVGEMWSAAW